MVLIDCEAAIAPWGTKARFKKAKLGLVKKNPTNNLSSPIYLIVNFGTNDMNKFPIHPQEIQLMPAAIRFTQLSKDVFIRVPNGASDTKLKPMLRKLRIIVEQDNLRKKGKGTAVDEILLNIPSVDRALSAQELLPTRTSAKIVANNNHNSQAVDTKAGGKVARLDNRQLMKINIEGVDVLPSNLWMRDTLIELHLVRCNLKSIPDQIHKFGDTLRILNLSQNLITELSTPFCCHMIKLSKLDVSDNLLKRVPLEVRFLNQLTSLNLSKNQLTILPSTFTDLVNLRELLLAHNKLKLLPAFHHLKVKLHKLDVSHNPLNDFSKDDADDNNTNDNDINLANIKYDSLYELATLRVIRSDSLFRLAHKELPPVLYSRIQRDVFKCFECNKLNLVPAFNISDQLDYVNQVESLETSGNLRHGMTFVKFICRNCYIRA